MRTWRVDDVMTTHVVTVSPDLPYRQVVDTLANRGVSAVPVVDNDGRVVGIVSEADLLHKIEFGDGDEQRIFAGRRRRQARAKAHGLVAADLMTAPAVTVATGSSLTAAAKLMDDGRVKRLPVTDEHGMLRGIVSRADLLRVYLRPDRDIARDVTDEVLGRTLWVDTGMVTATVQDGVVVLDGRTDRHSTKQLAVKLTQAVPGVVAVVDKLSYEFDDRELAHASPYGLSPFGVP